MTLEEEAKKHAGIPEKRDIDSEERYYNSNIVKYDSFIAGANSHAAKELWFKSKEFQAEKIKDQMSLLSNLRCSYDDTYYIYLEWDNLNKQLEEIENENH